MLRGPKLLQREGRGRGRRRRGRGGGGGGGGGEGEEEGGVLKTFFTNVSVDYNVKALFSWTVCIV